MMQKLAWSVGAIVLQLVFARTSDACTCQTLQPRLLIPGSSGILGRNDPILVGSTNVVTPFLYDSSGSPVELELIRQGAPLRACGGQYFLYEPDSSASGQDGEFELLLSDGVTPSVVTTLEKTSAFQAANVSLSATIEVARASIEPDVSSTGMCDPAILQGMTIDGAFECKMTLSHAAPVFMEAWYDEVTLGRVQDFVSSVPIRGAETAPEVLPSVRIELPHVQDSGDCIEMRLFTWTFELVWSDRICLAAAESQSRSVDFEMRQWDLQDTAKAAPTRSDSVTSGCSIARPLIQANPWPLHLLVVALLGRRCWRRRGSG